MSPASNRQKTQQFIENIKPKKTQLKICQQNWFAYMT